MQKHRLARAAWRGWDTIEAEASACFGNNVEKRADKAWGGAACEVESGVCLNGIPSPPPRPLERT